MNKQKLVLADNVELLKTNILDCNLSVRSINCLRAAGIDCLGEICTYRKEELLKFRNFGRKSLSEIEIFLKSKGLDFKQ